MLGERYNDYKLKIEKSIVRRNEIGTPMMKSSNRLHVWLLKQAVTDRVRDLSSSTNVAFIRVALSVCCFFGSEGRDDLLKARITAQRIPIRQQFQLTVADGARRPNGDG
jgi:hypothetical protein